MGKGPNFTNPICWTVEQLILVCCWLWTWVTQSST